MPVKIISVIAVTNEGDERKESNNPKFRKNDSVDTDISKILIPVVVGTMLLLTVTILVIHRGRNRR